MHAHAIMADPPDDRRELDELTFRRARAGEAPAFRALVERYQGPVFALLWRMAEPTVGAARVEELAQDAFVRVHQALARFEWGARGRLSSWILTIAARVALNELRRPRLVTVPIDEVDAAGSDRADEGAERSRLGRALRRALAALPPDHRAVVLLADYHELSYEEIAAELDLALGTVKSRLARARAALRLALEEVNDGRS